MLLVLIIASPFITAAPFVSNSVTLSHGDDFTLQATATCDPGMYLSDNSVCTHATPGYIADGTAQIVCDEGKYQPSAGQSTCIPAPSGYIVPNDDQPHVAPIPCAVDTAPDVSAAVCEASPGTIPVFPSEPDRFGLLHDARLTETGATADQQLGHRVAVDGDVMVATSLVGGNAALFTLVDGEWTHKTKLIPAGTSTFGDCVAVSAEWVVVGDGAAGKLFVFAIPTDRTTLPASLTAPTAVLDHEFAAGLGHSCAIDGTTIVGGAPLDGGASAAEGSAIIFEHTASWSFTQRLTMPGALASSRQGESVALHEGTLIISCGGLNKASVWTADTGPWVHQATIPTPGPAAAFASSVALSGSTAAISDPDDGAGAVLIYTREGAAWTLQTKIARHDGAPGAGFGGAGALALAGDLLVVGAPDVDTVYVYQRSDETWSFVAQQTALDGASAEFGRSVAMDETHIFTTSTDATGITDVPDRAGAVHTSAVLQATPVGMMVDWATGTTEPCPAGQYQSLRAQPWCTPCPAGRYSGGRAGGCVSVTPGYKTEGTSTRVQCPAGTYQPASGQTTCIDVDYGYYSPAGNFRQLGCPDGDHPNGAKDGCISGGLDYTLLSPAACHDGVVWDDRIDTPDGEHRAAELAISGDTMVVGYRDSGAADVYTRAPATRHWTRVARLTPAEPAPSFGAATAIQGDDIVVGAPSESSSHGKVFHYRRPADGWIDATESQALESPTRTAAEKFGNQVSIDGDALAVGAFGKDANRGAVYVFRRASPAAAWWGHTLIEPTWPASPNDFFGSAVELDAGTLVVAGYYADGEAPDEGLAAVYTTPDSVTFTLQTLLSPGSAGQFTAEGLVFGARAALDGDTLAIATYRYDTFMGAVFIFTRSVGVWTLEATITPHGGGAWTFFGAGLALRGDMLAVSTTTNADSPARPFVYRRRSSPVRWGLVAIPSDVPDCTMNGVTIGISGDTIITACQNQTAAPTTTALMVYHHVPLSLGHQTVGGDGMLTPTLPGRYQDRVNQPYDQACPDGTYSTGAAHECYPPAVGFKLAVDKKSQIPCDAGTYQPRPGQTECVAVDPGYVVPADGLPHAFQTSCGVGTPPQRSPHRL